MNDDKLNDDEKRALKAFTDVLAVEWDEQAGVARVVTLSDVYTAVPSEGMHLCPDREYHDVEMCKHLWALETVRGKIDAPEGWLVVDDLTDRTEPAFDVTAGLEDFEDFRVVTDGGTSMSGAEEIVTQIREFSEAIEDPGLWRILIPTDSFDSVKERLDTEYDTGTYYNGITLCYTKHHDEVRVEYKSDLSDHLRSVDENGDGTLVTDGGQVQKPGGMDKWTLHDDEQNATQHFEKRGEAEDKQAHAQKELEMDPDIYPPGQHPDADDAPEPETDADAGPMEDCANCGEPVPIREATAGPGGKPIHDECDGEDTSTDGGEVVEPEPAPDPGPAPDANHEPEVLSPDEVEQYASDLDDREVGQDPLKWMPGEFVDTIEGTEAINRRGFEVLRYFYGVDLDIEMEVDPEDNDMTHCRFKCVAHMDGQDIEAWGTSHVDRGDDPWLLVEMAATRARKRALSIATGAGAVAVEELKNEVEQ